MKKGFLSLLLAFFALGLSVHAANPDGALRIEVRASPNFVVDSNVESPSTYAPRSAFICAKVYNDGATDMTDVYVNIGDYINNTPGIYPTRTHLSLDGTFSFTHEGGSSGLDDAVRYIGTLAAGEVATMYWLISYPNLDDSGNAVHGPSVKPEDDLFLYYDVWATANNGTALEANVREKATMRNEISAQANKIWPNSVAKVTPELQDAYGYYEPTWTNTVLSAEPGTLITNKGIWFDLGNISGGFDNDGDTIPDQNAWLQPVGDPSLYDPAAYRLVKTHATIYVSMIDGTTNKYELDDDLYLTGIPKNNGAVGIVEYVFMSQLPNRSSVLTPYQEVASGNDNEKFNGDYGTQVYLPPPTTSRVDLVKDVDKATAYPGETLSYTVDFTNAGNVAVGNPELFTPLVVQDSVPTGTVYAGGAATGNTLPSGVTSYTVLYSTNYGVSWVSSEPATLSDVTDLQWWLSDALPTGTAGQVTFQLDVEDPYTPSDPLVVNTAGLSFGSSAPFLEDDAVTLILGTNNLGDTVFLDNGVGSAISGDGLQWGAEPGISNITVSLYYDLDGDGQLDSADSFISTTETDASGWYGFTNLPDGNYIVEVDDYDADLPLGSAITTPGFYAVDLDSAGTNANNVSYLDADFGFVPAIDLTKTLTSAPTNYEGNTVTFDITVTNQLDGYGGAQIYDVWTATNIPVKKNEQWTDESFAYGSSGPDAQAAYNLIESNTKIIELTDLSLESPVGEIADVYLHLAMWATGQVTWTTESVDIEVRDGGTAIFSTNLLGTAITNTLANSDWIVDISTNKAWSWSDFNSNNLSIYISGSKSGSPDDGTLFVDAAGFRVVTDWISTSNNPATTLDPVPLTDTFDADVLEFVSAYPAPQSVTTNGSYPDTVGTITWDNVGPIFTRASETISLTFTALEPDNNTQQTTTNTAWVDNVTYQDGRPANSVTDWADVVILPVGILGDYVWRDLNSNGLQDDGANAGISAVSVIAEPPAGMDLGLGAGIPVTNVTDASGYYYFTNYNGSGSVTVTVDTTTLPGGSGTCTYDEDSGTSSPDGTTIVTNFAHDATDGTDTHLTADFGYADVIAVIDGTVWNDLNRNGAAAPDTGEPWLTGVTVVLYQGATPIDTNTTDSSGYFQFTGAFDGTYTIQVDNTSGDMSSGTWTQSFDTDDHVATPNAVSVTVPAGGYGRGDFSYYETGLYDIGDLLFYDWNGNGTNDVGEPGVPNISMYLYIDVNTNDAIDLGTDFLLMTDVTDTNGLYLFENLFPTNYLVEVDRADADVPELYTFTADPVSPNDGISYLVISNADNLLQDFGIQPWGSGKIGDTVWEDLIPDAVQSDTEPGISNITVNLYWIDGPVTTLYATAVTDSTGWYLFEDLPDGDYLAVVDTTDTDLPTDSYGHDYLPTTPTEVQATIDNGSTFLDADFGFTPPGAIGDTIFWDANRNAEQDLAEDGVENVEVSLYIDANSNRVYDGGETLYATTNTTTNGFYIFHGLPPNDYVVVVTTNSGPLAGTELTADPSPDQMDSMHGIDLGYNQQYMGADFGYVPITGIIGDTVWLDMDSSGEREDGELGIPWVTVELWDASGFVTNTETDSGGWYMFMDLPDATYTVIVDTADSDFPANLAQTYDADGTLDDQTVDIVISGGDMVTVNGSSFTNELGIDFGYRYTGSNDLSGTIGLDSPTPDGMMGTNGSGYKADEAPFPNELVYVSLWNDDGDNILEAGETIPLGSTLTDTNGDYSFTGLPDGDGDDEYLVSYAPSRDELTLTTTVASRPVNVLSNLTNAAGSTLSTWEAVTIATTVTNVDFAFQLTDDWDFGDLPDSYRTQYQDDGARHLVPGTPTLYLGATAPDVDANGQPSVGADGDDTDGTDDEDGVSLLGRWEEGTDGGSLEITVGAGSGWLVGWIDFDGDGTFNASNEVIISEAASAGTSAYTFDVPADTFAAMTSTVLYARFRLFDAAPEAPAAAWYGSADNGEVEDYAFEFAALGDYVWYDLDGEGDQDAGEDPIPDVRVYLDLDGNDAYDIGEPYSMTDSNGLYTIVGLVAGTYTTRVDTTTLPTPPALFPSYDLDGTNTPHEAVATVTSGQYRTDVDYGYSYGTIDVGVEKTVDDAPFGATNVYTTIGSNLVYTMVITNYGPQVATSLQWTDNLPTGVTYQSHTTSTGTYDDVSGIWDVGTLAVDMTATMTITCVANANMTNQAITNWIHLSNLDQIDTNTNNNQSYAIIKPTVVTIARFEALTVDGTVTIEWETSSEIGTVGFFLLRRDGNKLIPVNVELLPAVPGAPQGSVYSVTDPDARTGRPYEYTLVEIEMGGGRNQYGPFTVTATRTASRGKGAGKEDKKPRATAAQGNGRIKALDFGNMKVRARSSAGKAKRMGRRLALGHARQAARRGHPHYAGGPVMKVSMQEAGVVRVTADEFIAATGGPTNDILAAFAAREIAVSCNGEKIACLYDEATASVLFYAQQIDSEYTSDNVYVLKTGRATTMNVLPGVAPPIGVPATYMESAHFEEDVYSVIRLITDPNADSWMWSFFVGGSATFGTRSYTLAAPGAAPDAAGATLTVRMQGSTSTGVENEHVLTVIVNGTEVGAGAWTGSTAYDLEIALPAGVLVDGDNTVTLVLNKGAGARYSVSYLNEFDLSYPRKLEAAGDRLLLRDTDAGAVTIGGFASETRHVWDIEAPVAPVVVQGVTVDGGKVAFTAEEDHDYMIFGEQGLLASTEKAPMQSGILKATTNAADYIVITIPELEDGAEALAAYRASLGLTTQTVFLEGIYDEFSYGIRTPVAIRSFLAYAHARWEGKPRYVVLAGEGTYDYKGTLGSYDCLVPPMRVATPSGLFASDGWFVDFDEDHVPELALGRLPVMSNDELTNLVAKIIAYEAAEDADWQAQALLIADNRDAGGNFKGAAELLARHLPADYTTHKAYLDDASLEATRATLLSALNSGVAFANYFGHSGLDRLGDEGQLTSADLAALTNAERLPVFTSMSCVMGRFAVPGYDCLAEELLLKQGGGAVAIWSPSGMALNPLSRVLAENFYKAVFEQGSGVLGDAIVAATEGYAAQMPALNSVAVFNLLGDPALRIAGRAWEAYPTEVDTYERWAKKWFSKRRAEGLDVSRTGDADGDGLTNFEEYALGSHPLQANRGRGLRLGTAGGIGDADRGVPAKPYDMEVVYERSKFASDAAVIVETTDDFITWHRNGVHVTETIVTDNGDGLTETVRVRIRGPRKRCFARLRLETRP